MAKIFNKQTRVVCGSFVPCGVDNSPCRSCRVAWNNTPCRSCVPSVFRNSPHTKTAQKPTYNAVPYVIARRKN